MSMPNPPSESTTPAGVDQSTWPAWLRDDAPYQKCSYCGRKTWTTEEFGRRCGMTLPGRRPCSGTFGPEIHHGD